MIIDGQGDDGDEEEDEEEEEKDADAVTEQFVTDMAYVLPIKQLSEESSDTNDYGWFSSFVGNGIFNC